MDDERMRDIQRMFADGLSRSVCDLQALAMHRLLALGLSRSEMNAAMSGMVEKTCFHLFEESVERLISAGVDSDTIYAMFRAAHVKFYHFEQHLMKRPPGRAI